MPCSCLPSEHFVSDLKLHVAVKKFVHKMYNVLTTEAF